MLDMRWQRRRAVPVLVSGLWGPGIPHQGGLGVTHEPDWVQDAYAILGQFIEDHPCDHDQLDACCYICQAKYRRRQAEIEGLVK